MRHYRPALIMKLIVAVGIGMSIGYVAETAPTAVAGLAAGSAVAMLPDEWFWR